MSSQVTIIYTAFLQCIMCESSFTVLNRETVYRNSVPFSSGQKKQQFNCRLQMNIINTCIFQNPYILANLIKNLYNIRSSLS